MLDSYFATTAGVSTMLVALDNDDYLNYLEIFHAYPRAFFTINPELRLSPKLNITALSYSDRYKYICFVSDDVVMRTKGWDEIFVNELEKMKVGIVYGDDMIKHEDLPTHVAMTSNIINELGYMIPPDFIHLYCDDFWLLLGKTCRIIKYLPEVILEHMHYTVGKAENDEIYKNSNSQDMYAHDKKAFEDYQHRSLKRDVFKILSLQKKIK